MVQYSYDSWENILSIADGQGEPITDENNIGHINPYRYRGYRYDKEIGLYYLQSRYYNAQWGRFVNGDGILLQNNKITGNNMYAYCQNNPINLSDPTVKYWRQIYECIKNPIAGVITFFQLFTDFNEAPKKYYPKTYNRKDGSQSNAFKHINMSAKITYESGEKFAKRLTDAHELDQPSKDKKMDYANNKIGIEIGNIVKQEMIAYQQSKNMYTATIAEQNIADRTIEYLDKTFIFNPKDSYGLIEEMAHYAVESGKAIVLFPDSGD